MAGIECLTFVKKKDKDSYVNIVSGLEKYIETRVIMSYEPQALHQPRHTRHSLHAGSGAGCVMYTLAMPPVLPAIIHLAGVALVI